MKMIWALDFREKEGSFHNVLALACVALILTIYFDNMLKHELVFSIILSSWKLKISPLIYFFMHLGAMPNSSQGLLLVLYSGITPGGLEVPYRVPRIEQGQLWVKRVPYPMYYHSILCFQNKPNRRKTE